MTKAIPLHAQTSGVRHLEASHIQNKRIRPVPEVHSNIIVLFQVVRETVSIVLDELLTVDMGILVHTPPVQEAQGMGAYDKLLAALWIPVYLP